MSNEESSLEFAFTTDLPVVVVFIHALFTIFSFFRAVGRKRLYQCGLLLAHLSIDLSLVKDLSLCPLCPRKLVSKRAASQAKPSKTRLADI